MKKLKIRKKKRKSVQREREREREKEMGNKQTREQIENTIRACRTLESKYQRERENKLRKDI